MALGYDNLHGYQKIAIEHMYNNPKSALFLDMGLGKTVTTLTFLNKILYEELDVKRVLIVAPKRVVESVWDSEVEKWEHIKHLKLTKIIGSEKNRRLALLERTDIHLISRDNITWLCAQYGGYLPYDCLVIDESSSFKSHSSKRFKSLRIVLHNFKRVVLLTGTPSPNGLLDLWAQIYLLDKGERLGKNISHYREDFFKPNKMNGAIVYSYKTQQDGEERIHRRISDICLSMKAKDYLDMPERVNNYIMVEFDAKLRKQYKQFEEDKIMEIVESEVEVTAMGAAALVNKLLQFCNGAVYDEDKTYHVVHDLKLDALEEILENDDKPLLVAYTYQHDKERIMQRFKKYKPVALSGNKDIEAWNRGEIRMMVMHPASGGHGLNLQYGGNTIVWFGLNWSLELYEQFNARLDRQGQTNGVVIHHIVAKSTYDESVIKSLKEKSRVQDSLMEAVKLKINEYKKQYGRV